MIRTSGWWHVAYFWIICIIAQHLALRTSLNTVSQTPQSIVLVDEVHTEEMQYQTPQHEIRKSPVMTHKSILRS